MTAACGHCAETVEVEQTFFGIMDCPHCGKQIDIQARVRKLGELAEEIEKKWGMEELE